MFNYNKALIKQSTCGVYCLTNTVNGKVYIGQSVNVGKRLTNHKDNAKSGRGGCSALYSAIRKYGFENFQVSLVVECDRQYLDWFERMAILASGSMTPNGYNLEFGGNQCTVVSDETRRKMSLAHKGKKKSPESVRKRAIARTGIPRSDEVKRKISEGNKGKHSSKRKLSQALKGKKAHNHSKIIADVGHNYKAIEDKRNGMFTIDEMSEIIEMQERLGLSFKELASVTKVSVSTLARMFSGKLQKVKMEVV